MIEKIIDEVKAADDNTLEQMFMRHGYSREYVIEHRDEFLAFVYNSQDGIEITRYYHDGEPLFDCMKTYSMDMENTMSVKYTIEYREIPVF